MGDNRLAEVMKKMADTAGLQGRYTNHGVRCKIVNQLLRAGVHPIQAAQLSGHKRPESLYETQLTYLTT